MPRGVHRAAISIYIATVIGAVKSPNLLRVPPDSICSFYLNGDLLGAIAQAAFKGADVRPVWPRYHACKHHRSVAFRAWRPFNFNGTAISDEGLCHVLLA
ncbi:MAG: hypothetical protein QOK23_4601 [Gammaproteobacteria bacterium]|nr:hypothetical protein [Gammaproteobacteria bacterium]